MNIPQDIINPPAIVYQISSRTLEQKVQSPDNSPYFNQICESWGHWLQRFVCSSVIPGKSWENIRQLRGKQTIHSLNHLSWADTLFVPYHHWLVGLDETIKIARVNAFGIPHFGKIFSKCKTLAVPMIINMKKGRPYIRSIRKNLKEGEGFTVWAEGTRNRTEEIKEFQEGTFRVIYQYAVDKSIDLTISPEAVVYDRVIEKPFFWLSDFFRKYRHSKGGRWFYERADLVPFGIIFLRNLLCPYEKGVIVHAFGEPFSIHECKNETELKERARESTLELKREYQDRIKDWNFELPKSKFAEEVDYLT